MLYRKACFDDMDELIRLRKQQLSDEGIVETCDIDNEMREFFTSGLSEASFVSWLAVENGEIIATSGVCFYRLPPTYANPSGITAYVTSMYTKDEYRRKGIATALLGKILGEVRARGDIRIARLHASKDGKALYAKFGFMDSEGYMALKI